MRKYFLLSAVALLAATSANATTDYAEVTAKATIEVATKFSCDELNWGTIVVKQDNEEFLILQDGSSTSDDLISISGNGLTSCSYDDLSDVSFPETNYENVILTNDNGDEIELTEVYSFDNEIGTTLVIPDNVQPGEYEGHFTITLTY